jgi:hypothetical protein
MSLLTSLQAQRDASESYFARALLAEDIERLTRVRGMLTSAASFDAFRKQALYAGWTRDDMRTHELLVCLEPLLKALWDEHHGGTDASAVMQTWRAFQALRLERLVGCLARTPAPDT